MARKKRVVVSVVNPISDNDEVLKVHLFVYPSDDWRGVDSDEEDEFDPDVDTEVFQVDALVDGEWVDVSEKWEFSEDLPELEEAAREAYLERELEKYAEKIIG